MVALDRDELFLSTVRTNRRIGFLHDNVLKHITNLDYMQLNCSQKFLSRR